MAKGKKVSVEIELLDRMSGTLDKLNRKMDGLGERSRAAQKELDAMDGVTGRLRKSLASLGVAFGLKELVGKIVSVRGEMQQLQVAFETMLGSAEKAQGLMEQLVHTAAVTPFGLEDVSNGARQLLAYGTEAEKVNATLVKLGDIAAGLSMPLNDLVYLYGTTMTQGRLYTQDLNQFTGRGIPMIQELAKQFGVAESKVKELVEAGKVGFPEVEKVIDSLTGEGSKFGGLMEEQSKTITGQIANIEDAIDMMMNDLGQQSEGVINGVLGQVSYMVEHYERFGRILLGVAGTWGVYRTAVMVAAAASGAASVAEAAHLNWILLVEKAQKLLNATMLANPYVLVATAAAGLVAVMVSMKTETELMQEADEAYEAEKQKTIAAEEEHRRRLEELIGVAGDESMSTDTRRTALVSLIQMYPKVFEKYETEYEMLKNIRNIKQEIAELDGKGSMQKTQNEIKTVDARIAELERKKSTSTLTMSGATVGGLQMAGLSAREEAELKALKRRREKLTNQVRKEDADAYLKDLTGVSNKDLEKQIKERENLLAKMTATGHKKGYVKGGGAQGQFSRDELEGQLQLLKAEQAERKAERKTAGGWTSEDKKAYEKALKEYNDFVSDTTTKMTEQEREKRLKELTENLEAAEKAYNKSKPKTNKDAEKNAKAEAARKKALAKADREEEQRKQREEQLGLELAETVRQNEADRIAAMEEGTEKELAQIKNDYQKRRNEIDKQEADWKKENKKAGVATGEDGLTDDQRTALEDARKIADDAEAKAQEKLWKTLLEKYRSYEQQREAIRKQYAEERKSIEGADVDENLKTTALAELEKQEKAALKQVDDAELEEMERENQLLVELFQDTSARSVAEIEKIIGKVKLLMDYMKGTKGKDGTSVVKDGSGKVTRRISRGEVLGLGFSEEELKTLEKSPEKLKAILDQYKKLKQETLSKNPFTALAKAVEDLFAKGDGDEGLSLKEKIQNLGEGAAAAAGKVKEMADQLQGMFEAAGNDGMAEAMGDVSSAMSTVQNVAKGFVEGGVFGGIAALAGEAIGYMTKAFTAAARHKEALKEIMQEVIAQQREYNLLLMEQNLEYEKAQTIFGTDSYAQAVNAVKVMKDAYADLKAEMEGTAEQQEKFAKGSGGSSLEKLLRQLTYSELKDAYSGLADIQIKTGHKKTGLFGWGKGKDVYSSILDAYPELIDASGELNGELAESVLNSRVFKDNDKEALQYIIDLYDQAEEAWESVKDYFEGIFGDLGTTLSDSLSDAFRNGTDAAETFVDSVTEMLENLAEQMIYTVTLAPYLEKAQEDMLAVMKNENLTDEQKFQNYVSILAGMTDEALAQQETYNALMSQYQNMAAAKGIDLWQQDSTSQTGKSGAFTSMTQNQGTKLEGMFTSGLRHWSSMDARLETVVERMGSAESHLARIVENTTSSAVSVGEIKEELKKMVRDGLKVK